MTVKIILLGFSCGSDHCLAVLRRVGAKKQVPFSFLRWSWNLEVFKVFRTLVACCLLLLLDIYERCYLQELWCWGSNACGQVNASVVVSVYFSSSTMALGRWQYKWGSVPCCSASAPKRGQSGGAGKWGRHHMLTTAVA